MLYLGRGKQPKAFELITYLIHLIYCSLNFKIQIFIKCRFFLSLKFLIASFLCKIMLVKRVIKRNMFGMVKYLHPILVNFQTESYEKQIFKNHCTKNNWFFFSYNYTHHTKKKTVLSKPALNFTQTKNHWKTPKFGYKTSIY